MLGGSRTETPRGRLRSSRCSSCNTRSRLQCWLPSPLGRCPKPRTQPAAPRSRPRCPGWWHRWRSSPRPTACSGAGCALALGRELERAMRARSRVGGAAGREARAGRDSVTRLAVLTSRAVNRSSTWRPPLFGIISAMLQSCRREAFRSEG